jgi:hypothetical protein
MSSGDAVIESLTLSVFSNRSPPIASSQNTDINGMLQG